MKSIAILSIVLGLASCSKSDDESHVQYSDFHIAKKRPLSAEWINSIDGKISFRIESGRPTIPPNYRFLIVYEIRNNSNVNINTIRPFGELCDLKKYLIMHNEKNPLEPTVNKDDQLIYGDPVVTLKPSEVLRGHYFINTWLYSELGKPGTYMAEYTYHAGSEQQNIINQAGMNVLIWQGDVKCYPIKFKKLPGKEFAY